MYIKREVRIFAGLLGVCVAAGCGESSSDRANEQTSGSSVLASRSATNGINSVPLTETGRTNSSSRTYSSSTNSTETFKDADNTGRNVRDRSDATVTSEDQSNSDADLQITRQIRRALTANDQFSTTAKNIKIITADGKVTLRGPVQNEQEKQAVLSAAQIAAGSASIDDQLEVKNNQ